MIVTDVSTRPEWNASLIGTWPGTSQVERLTKLTGHLVVAMAVIFSTSFSDAKTKRSTTARHEFVRLNACPSTERHRLPCPGHVIDHIKALACGGPDAPVNMQWQTIQEAKAKDKWERKECGK